MGRNPCEHVPTDLSLRCRPERRFFFFFEKGGKGVANFRYLAEAVTNLKKKLIWGPKLGFKFDF